MQLLRSYEWQCKMQKMGWIGVVRGHSRSWAMSLTGWNLTHHHKHVKYSFLPQKIHLNQYIMLPLQGKNCRSTAISSHSIDGMIQQLPSQTRCITVLYSSTQSGFRVVGAVRVFHQSSSTSRVIFPAVQLPVHSMTTHPHATPPLNKLNSEELAQDRL